nr:hypothetical protein [Tanacetum cinerariifolium]
MAAPGPSNHVARHVVDDLVNFSGETSMPKVMKLFFGQQIEEIKAIDDEEDMFDTLMFLRDDTRDENNKLMELNGFIAQVEERIAIKEEHVRVMEASGEIAESSRLQDKIKLVFSRAHIEDESFIGLMHDICSGLRLTRTKNRRLIVELEALGQRGDALQSLEYMREMVIYDSAMLGALEQLLASTHVGMRLKASYVTDMDEAE